MALAEAMGLRPIPIPTSDYIGCTGYPGATGLNLATDFGVFLHPRDYVAHAVQKYHGQYAPDGSAYVRVYDLYADNTFDNLGNWNGRKPQVSKAREWIFSMELLGFPWIDDSGDTPVLRRQLPQPLDWGLNFDVETGEYSSTDDGIVVWDTTGFTYLDTRGGNSVSRFTHFATRILKTEPIGCAPQSLETDAPWDILVSDTVPPDESAPIVRFHVLFERVPYEVMFSLGPYYAETPEADPAFGGEWSRFTIWETAESTSALQVRGGAVYDSNASHYGNPGSPMPATTPFANKEGFPLKIYDARIGIRWLEVPVSLFAANWIANLNQNFGGQVNGTSNNLPTGTNSPWPASTSTFPFRQYNSETLLFEVAGSKPRTSNNGVPVEDIVIWLENRPAPDGFGAFNRILNSKSQFQRYKNNVTGNPYYGMLTFDEIFSPS